MTTDFNAQSLFQDLVKYKHIIPVGVPGIFGRGPIFEEIIARFEALITKIGIEDGAEKITFPPCISRSVIERSGYLDSFPQLAGTVFSFKGSESDHRELSNRLIEQKTWSDMQTMTDACLAPAACYPVYPTCTGSLPDQGRLIDVQNWVFRHEPSDEPTRMMSFRIREFVRLGDPETVVEWRNLWLERGIAILKSLALPVHAEVATDPFFGKGGRMLKANQRDQKLKFEVMAPVISKDQPTALCSFNYHQDKFGKIFSISTASGKPAETACLGFGLERIAMALLKTHGMLPQDWPKEVREVLWP